MSQPPPAPADALSPAAASPRGRKWLMKGAQLLIAVVGIWWVVSNLTIRDRVNVVRPDGLVESTALVAAFDDDTGDEDEVPDRFEVAGSPTLLTRADVVSQPDRKTVKVRSAPGDAASPIVETPLLGIHLTGNINHAPVVDALIIQDPGGPGGLRIAPADVVGGFALRTPRPVVEKGLLSMWRTADPWLLALAIVIFPVTVVMTTVRWRAILRSQDIHLPFARVFVLNMVGAFYNSFLPGSTGGDFMKAIQVSRQTSHKIRAVISVFVDRVIGLLALVILGGAMATYGFLNATDAAARSNVSLIETFIDGAGPLNPTARACLQVALACAAICLGVVGFAAIVAPKRLRTALGFDYLAARLPMQHHLNKVREAARLYKRNAPRVIWWIILTFPIHITVVISAIIAGRAFGLSIAWPFYFVCVPVMVLVAALPISPQGAGVMEWFGFLLLAKQGATVSEVLALTLSIRFVQLFWNLVGGLFAIGGDFGAGAASYDAIADADTDPEPGPTPAAAV